MTFFDKTLDEILDIITDVNEQIYNQVNIDGDAPSIAITFEFCEFWAAFKILKVVFPDAKIINEKLDTFKTIQL